MRIIIILVIFVRYYKNKERMRRRNRMQRPVNIGGTGREGNPGVEPECRMTAEPDEVIQGAGT